MNKSDRYRMYWSGKSPRVRKATEDYFKQPLHPIPMWKTIAAKHGVSEVALRNNVNSLRRLAEEGYLELP